MSEKVPLCDFFTCNYTGDSQTASVCLCVPSNAAFSLGSGGFSASDSLNLKESAPPLTSFVFICAAQLSTGTWSGSHPTPRLLLVNNFYKGFGKTKGSGRSLHGTEEVHIKRQRGDKTEWRRLTGCRAKMSQHYLYQQRYFNSNIESQMWNKTGHLHRIISGSLISLCFYHLFCPQFAPSN